MNSMGELVFSVTLSTTQISNDTDYQTTPILQGCPPQKLGGLSSSEFTNPDLDSEGNWSILPIQLGEMG